MLTGIACVPLLIWIYLLVGRHAFWRVSRHFAATETSQPPTPTVAVVIPARNEAATIGRALTSLLQQDFPGLLRVIVVDDSSQDDTGNVAKKVAEALVKGARLNVLQAQPLPPGWTGKMWAVAAGVAEAEQLRPDYLLLTDADIEHAPGNIANLVRIAESGSYDLVSYMVKLSCQSVAEKFLIPAFVFFFFLLYPPAAIRSPRCKTAGAAGGCMLIRTAALHAAGGIAPLRAEVIDDCALANRVKKNGGRVWLGLTATTRSLRTYKNFGDIERMIARTAFNQLRHSWLLLIATCLALLIVYVFPVALLFSGQAVAAILGAAAWALMSVAYAPMVRFYRRSWAWSFTLPFAALFYMVATIHSAVQYAGGRGGEWKGRTQDAKT
jgi:hopene-associated glycosyltransferase HpnB